MVFNNYDKVRILVTGGAGFLGSHLCERLLEEGNYTICLDNYYTGQIKNIEHLMDNRNIGLAGEKLNWEPKIGVEDGLKKTIQYFRELISQL